MDAPAVLRRGRPVDRGPHERMAEAHLGAELDQARRRRRGRRAALDPERGGRLPHQQRIAHRLGRRDQEQEPRRRRQLRQPLLEALLDAAGQRRPAVQPEPARQLGGRPAARQLQQRQRVAARLGHDPIAHPLVERTRHHGLQQRLRITVVQPADDELRQPLEMPLAGRLAHGEDQPDRLGPQTARHERQRLRRRAVEPLRIVHDADQRPLLRHVGQQAQDRQADEEAIRRVAVAQAERRAERLALRAGKALQAIHERRAELMQPGERELHLRLDARRPGDAAARRVPHQVLEQRALADAGLAAQHQRPARTRAHARHQLIQRRALAAPAEQLAAQESTWPPAEATDGPARWQPETRAEPGRAGCARPSFDQALVEVVLVQGAELMSGCWPLSHGGPPIADSKNGRTTSIPRLETRCAKSSVRWTCSLACCSKRSTSTISAIST